MQQLTSFVNPAVMKNLPTENSPQLFRDSSVFVSTFRIVFPKF